MNTTATTPTSDASISGARSWFAEKGLSRPHNRRLLGGVSAAYSRRYGMNLLVTRLLAVMSALVLTPLPYIALWVLMPRES